MIRRYVLMTSLISYLLIPVSKIKDKIIYFIISLQESACKRILNNPEIKKNKV
jgi:hypothetical protein